MDRFIRNALIKYAWNSLLKEFKNAYFNDMVTLQPQFYNEIYIGASESQ